MHSNIILQTKNDFFFLGGATTSHLLDAYGASPPS